MKKAKASTVPVVVLKKFTPVNPKGQKRRELSASGRVQSLRFTRDMNDKQVRDKVCDCFKCSTTLTLLDCIGGHSLCKSGDQTIDLEALIDRKSTLYFCEEFNVSFFVFLALLLATTTQFSD